MKKRILDYLAKVNQILQADATYMKWDEIKEEHLTQISFFQHERLIHLLVTVLFANLAFLTLILMTIKFTIPVLVLFVAILILLIPYINHYYLLENSVQKMYQQYDEILKHCKERK